jgi:hypothetical protein
MQKPLKKNLKDFLLEKTSEDLQMDLETVEKVMGWSYKKANQATQLNKEVEISGFGKLLLSESKYRKYMERLLKMSKNDPTGYAQKDIEEISKKWG